MCVDNIIFGFLQRSHAYSEHNSITVAQALFIKARFRAPTLVHPMFVSRFNFPQTLKAEIEVICQIGGISPSMLTPGILASVASLMGTGAVIKLSSE